VAQNLRGLYHFMSRQLQEANLNRDPQRIEEIISLLEELNVSWKAITA
jgi:flagellin-specific chaperone FliS